MIMCSSHFLCATLKTGREDEVTLCKMFLESHAPGIQKLTDDSKIQLRAWLLVQVTESAISSESIREYNTE